MDVILHDQVYESILNFYENVCFIAYRHSNSYDDYERYVDKVIDSAYELVDEIPGRKPTLLAWQNFRMGKIGNWYFAFKVGKDGNLYVRDACHHNNMDNKAHPIILDDDFIPESYSRYYSKNIHLIKKIFEYDYI